MSWPPTDAGRAAAAVCLDWAVRFIGQGDFATETRVTNNPPIPTSCLQGHSFGDTPARRSEPMPRRSRFGRIFGAIPVRRRPIKTPSSAWDTKGRRVMRRVPRPHAAAPPSDVFQPMGATNWLNAAPTLCGRHLIHPLPMVTCRSKRRDLPISVAKRSSRRLIECRATPCEKMRFRQRQFGRKYVHQHASATAPAPRAPVTQRATASVVESFGSRIRSLE